MDNKEMLDSIKKIYPSDKVTIRFLTADENNTAVLKISRLDEFTDGLSSIRPYRVLFPMLHKSIAAMDSGDVLAALADEGHTTEEIKVSLEESLMDMLMIMEAKNSMIKNTYEPSVLDKARIKHDALDAEFEASKNDPAAFAAFMTKLINGTPVPPSLTVVGEDDAESGSE